MECSDPRVLASLLSLVRRLLASLLPLPQLHLQPIDRIFLRPYLQLLDFYATAAGDVFSEVSGFGGGALLYSVEMRLGEEIGDDDGGERRRAWRDESSRDVGDESQGGCEEASSRRVSADLRITSE